MNTDMDLFELILFDVILVLVFACFLLTAVFFTESNLFLILLSLVFGAITCPFSRTFGGWLAMLRAQEREILSPRTRNKAYAKWILFDFGIKGNTWVFRVASGITAVFAAYNLIRYLAG